MTTQEYNAKLQALREQYKTASISDRKIIKLRADFLKASFAKDKTNNKQDQEILLSLL